MANANAITPPSLARRSGWQMHFPLREFVLLPIIGWRAVLICSSATALLALFMRRGMCAWMQAWSQCVVAPPTSPAQPPQTQEICPVQLHADVVTLLASMVLFARQEAIA